MNYFPPSQALSCTAALLLFAGGWILCAFSVFRFLPRCRLAEAAAVGFVLWNTLIAAGAVVLDVTGLFSVAAFLLVPAAGAAGLALFALRHFELPAVRANLLACVRQPLFLLAACLLVFFFLQGLHLNLSYPPNAWDTYQYHRATSAMILQEEGLYDLPCSNLQMHFFPKNGEIAAAWMLAIARWDSPLRTLPLMSLAVIVFALYSAFRHWGVRQDWSLLLASTAVCFPGVLVAALRDVGDIDINLAAHVCVALSLLSGVLTREEDHARHAIVCAAVLGTLAGIKGSAVASAAVLGMGLTAACALRRTGWRHYAIVLATAGAVFALVSSYWLVHNTVTQGNPIYPVTVRWGETVVLPGYPHFDARNMTTVTGVPELLRPYSKLGRLARSMAIRDQGDFVWGGHAGGWGWQFLVLTIPLWLLGISLSFLRRDWRFLTLLGTLVLLLFATPSNWWVRFSLPFLTASVLAAVPLVRAIRWRPATNLVLIPAAVFSWQLALHHVGQVRYVRFTALQAAEMQRNGRTVALPADGFRVFDERDAIRDMTRYVSNRVRPGMSVAFDFGDWPPFPALLYNGTYSNVVRQVDYPTAPIDEYDVLVVATSEHPDLPALLPDWVVAYSSRDFIVFWRRTSHPPDDAVDVEASLLPHVPSL
ncbi:MAG: hypothetical protein PWP23_1688 [Candidatus Sumerlaeota bacterium]|nr:hypothetical protein [Candidatus Sumerlaeota bacterium]